MASGIGGDVAADLARPLGAERQREHQARIGRGLVNGFQHDSGLDNHGLTVAVDRPDAVHPFKRQNDLTAAFVRHLAADKAGIAALGNNRLALGGGKFEDRGNLIGRAGPQDGRAAAVKQFTPFAAIRRLVVFAGQHIGVSDNVGKPGEQAVGFHGAFLSNAPPRVETERPDGQANATADACRP